MRRRHLPAASSRRLRAGFVALLVGALAGCSRSEPSSGGASAAPASAAPDARARPNVVLISVDTLRSDHTSPYGYERDTTPSLAKLARDGARFDTAYAHTPTTGPSHATMLTARLPIGHGAVRNGASLREEVPTLTEILKKEGYQTAAFVSAYVLLGKFGFERGFDTYDAELAQDVGDRELTACAKEDLERCADQTVDAALRWLDEDRDPNRPLFLFVHLFDPHRAYSPPAEYRKRFGAGETAPGKRKLDWQQKTAVYDAEIAFTDHEIGRLLEAFDRHGLRDDTILLLTADHGEALGAHGIPNHGVALYEELVRVPLLVRYPGRIEGGKVIEEPVGLFDVMPTVLELAGMEAAVPSYGGRSAAGALLGRGTLDPERAVYLQRRHYETEKVMGIRVKGDAFGVRMGRWKYLESDGEGKGELYDLEVDPFERDNLVEREPERARAMAEELERWKSAHGGDAVRGAPQQVSEADRQKLRALGYVD